MFNKIWQLPQVVERGGQAGKQDAHKVARTAGDLSKKSQRFLPFPWEPQPVCCDPFSDGKGGTPECVVLAPLFTGYGAEMVAVMKVDR
jgi:hypothetical protein